MRINLVMNPFYEWLAMKPRNPPLQSTHLLDPVRERIRYLQYSLSTEKVYWYWIRFFIRWHGRSGQMKHPCEMGAPEVEAILTVLATDRPASKRRIHSVLTKAVLKVAAGGTASPLDALAACV